MPEKNGRKIDIRHGLFEFRGLPHTPTWNWDLLTRLKCERATEDEKMPLKIEKRTKRNHFLEKLLISVNERYQIVLRQWQKSFMHGSLHYYIISFLHDDNFSFLTSARNNLSCLQRKAENRSWERRKRQRYRSVRDAGASTLYWMNQHSFPRLLEQIRAASVRLRVNGRRNHCVLLQICIGNVVGSWQMFHPPAAVLM